MKPKTIKIIYWITTVFIFLFEGVVPALTSQTDMAKQAIKHLGYPEYFDVMLVVFRVLGVIAIIIPQIPSRIKEWAYAGFSFDFICALISLWVVDGFGITLLFPVIASGILATSYISYHKLQNFKLS